MGYDRPRNFRNTEGIAFHRQFKAPIAALLISDIERAGGSAVRQENGLIRINDEFTIAIAIARYNRNRRNHCWDLRYDAARKPDILAVLRLNTENTDPLDCYIIPRDAHVAAHPTIGRHNAVRFAQYRFDDFSPLVAMSRRHVLPEFA